MRLPLLHLFPALYSVAQAARSVSIGADPRYKALPFCARDCLWNDNNVGDVAESISFIFPCYNSCYCSADSVAEAIASLRSCISASPCCDKTDYTNAVALYYSYCNSQQPWSMPLPSEVGTVPPSSTSRITSLSTASWCSTAHFSPTSTSTKPTSKTSKTSSPAQTASTTSPTVTPVASSSEDGAARTARLLSIIIPSVAGTIVVAIVLCAWMVWRRRRNMGRSIKDAFAKRQTDATPLIIANLPGNRQSTRSPSPDPTEVVYFTEQERHVGGGKDDAVPPPYTP